MNPFLETSTAIICSEKGQLTGRIKIDPQIAAARLMALKCGVNMAGSVRFNGARKSKCLLERVFPAFQSHRLIYAFPEKLDVQVFGVMESRLLTVSVGNFGRLWQSFGSL